MTQTVKADPSLRRQLADRGPLILWRDAAGGRREGLVLAVDGCRDPGCDCREVALEAKRVSDQLLEVDADTQNLVLTFREGAGDQERHAFWTTADVDTGALEPLEDAEPQDPDALAWLRAELDDELLATLRAQREGLRNAASPDDWKQVDWSGWTPGARISWANANPVIGAASLMLDDREFLCDEFFATEAADGADIVEVFFDEALIQDGEPALEPIGCVEVVPEKLELAVQLAEPGQEELLEALWKRYCERSEVQATLIARRARILEIGGELSRQYAEKHAPVRKDARVNPNEKCPCGSGQKYKRCCGRA
jgi:hypothetical protein